MSATVTQTKTQKESKTKDTENDIKQVLSTGDNLDNVLKKVKKLDNACAYLKCKTNVALIGINCQYCKKRFCAPHCLPEIHGCEDLARKTEQEKFKHPSIKVTKDEHDKAQTKLNQKLKQMQLERKAKPGGSKKK